ncbi:MAG TPA: hypothetical protein VMU01_00310 [Rhizomicrobium sp.]|nr:hypothetical protein [Rhizomicrobium sp.]
MTAITQGRTGAFFSAHGLLPPAETLVGQMLVAETVEVGQQRDDAEDAGDHAEREKRQLEHANSIGAFLEKGNGAAVTFSEIVRAAGPVLRVFAAKVTSARFLGVARRVRD